MAQARTLEEQELARVLAYIEHGRHAHRNRAMLLLTHWAGLRVGEVAVLRWSDVTNSDGAIKDEIGLIPDMTKGRHARTVWPWAVSLPISGWSWPHNATSGVR